MRIINNRAESIEARLRRLKKHYIENPPKNFNLAVIDCCFWNALTNAQAAEILNATEDEVRFEVDIIIQQSQ